MRAIAVGRRLVHSVRPQAADLASSIGNAGVDVVSTPAMIGYLETAAHLLLQSAYEAGEASVGTHVNVEHVDAAALGDEIVCEAVLAHREGSSCVFDVSAHQNGRLIMRGRHTRRVVDLERFITRLRRR